MADRPDPTSQPPHPEAPAATPSEGQATAEGQAGAAAAPEGSARVGTPLPLGAHDPGLDPADLDWSEDDVQPPGRRGLTLRHPLLLVLVLAGTVLLMVRSWPQVAYLLNARESVNCGNLSERPFLRAEGKPEPALAHDTWCTLDGVVESLTIYATGEARDSGDPRTRDQGRKYYVKLNGEDMFAVLDAGRAEVAEYRIRKGNLFGFEVTGPGRIIDLSKVPGFADTDRFLRHRFRVTEGQAIKLYDTTETPNERWPYALVFGLMGLTGLLALLGLIRVLLARRKA